MVRSKKSNGALWFDGKHFKLNPFQRRRLIDDLLGIDIDDPENEEGVTIAAENIERALSKYLGAIGNKPPTASHYLADLNGEYGKNEAGRYTSGLRIQAQNLINSLAETSFCLENEFEGIGYDLNALAGELARFLDSANKLNQKFENEKQTRKPKDTYFKAFINQLKGIFLHFHIFYDGEEDDEMDKRLMAAHDRQMYDFIKTAIEYTGKTPPKSDRSIEELFYKNGEKELYFNKV